LPTSGRTVCAWVVATHAQAASAAIQWGRLFID
jgi:hypothetical protein